MLLLKIDKWNIWLNKIKCKYNEKLYTKFLLKYYSINIE